MYLKEWLEVNRSRFGSEFEAIFAERVLPRIPELKLDAISVQYPFRDIDRKQRYCDFVIQEDDSVRIAIEIDGYDKTGQGTGMTRSEFIDWQRRQASLTSLGWYVLRFANVDVRDQPARCAEHVSLLLRRTRAKSKNEDLTAEERARLESLTLDQDINIKHLTNETSVMKITIAAFTLVIAMLLGVVVWQGSARTESQPQVAPAAASPQTSANSGEGLLPMRQTPVLANTAVEQRKSTSAASLPAPNGVAGQSPSAETKQPSSTRANAAQDQPLEVAAVAERSRDVAPSESASLVAAATVPAGASCDSPIAWQQAAKLVGQTVALVGPVMKITQPSNVNGNPTWVDIGAVFPSTQRLSVVIWGEHASNFPLIRPGQVEGRSVCVMGAIKTYKGTPQIVLELPSQIRFVRSVQ